MWKTVEYINIATSSFSRRRRRHHHHHHFFQNIMRLLKLGISISVSSISYQDVINYNGTLQNQKNISAD